MNFKDAAPDLEIVRASMEVVASDARAGKSSKLEGELAQIIMDLIDAKEDCDPVGLVATKNRFKVNDKARIRCVPFGDDVAMMYLGHTGTVVAVGEGLYGVIMRDGRPFLVSDTMLAKL